MCDLLEQHWLSSTPSTRLKMLFVSLGWVCSNLHESKFEWDENKLVFSLFRTELWGKEQDWTSVIVRVSLWWTELIPLSFGRVTKIEKNRKKRSFFCGPKLFLPFLLICWTKTETQQNKKKIVWTTKTEQNKKGKKKKLKHQSFVLWRGSETMTRLLLSCWCFAEFLAALCFIMLWRRGLCECLGKHGWYFEMYPHPSCFRKGHCDLYQCFPSLLCDCGPFWVVTSFCCVSFQFGQVFRVEVPLHYVCHVSCQDSMSSSAAVDVKLLSSWFTVFIGLNSLWPPFWCEILLWFHWWWQQLQLPSIQNWLRHHSFGDLHEVQVQQIANTPDTLTCSRKKSAELLILSSCFCFLSFVFVFFFFFGCLGGLIEVTQCWSSNPHWCVCFVNNKQ